MFVIYAVNTRTSKSHSGGNNVVVDLRVRCGVVEGGQKMKINKQETKKYMRQKIETFHRPSFLCMPFCSVPFYSIDIQLERTDGRTVAILLCVYLSGKNPAIF